RLARFTRETMRDKTNAKFVGNTPESSLCPLIEAYLEAIAACGAYRNRRRIALLHRIREDARARLAALKRQRRVQTYDDLIDGVADALDGPHGGSLARHLREQYAVALVD